MSVQLVEPRRFGLVEIVIIGIVLIAAGLLAVPSTVRADPVTESAARVGDDLLALRTAIREFEEDHGALPSVEAIAFQLTAQTDRRGLSVNPLSREGAVGGPYMAEIPSVEIDGSARSGIGSKPGPGIGWIYNPQTGSISPAAVRMDEVGNLVTTR